MKWIFLVLLFLGLLVFIWVVMLLLFKPVKCPSFLSNDYYSCNNDVDCYYHPKYQCISKPLNCMLSEDLSSRQEISKLFYCECVNNKCITKRINN